MQRCKSNEAPCNTVHWYEIVKCNEHQYLSPSTETCRLVMTFYFILVHWCLNTSHLSVQRGIGGGSLLVPISCSSRDPEWVRMTWLFRAWAWATSSMVTGCVLKRVARVLRRTLWAPSRGGTGERSSSSLFVHRATLAPTLLLVPFLFVLFWVPLVSCCVLLFQGTTLLQHRFGNGPRQVKGHSIRGVNLNVGLGRQNAIQQYIPIIHC